MLVVGWRGSISSREEGVESIKLWRAKNERRDDEASSFMEVAEVSSEVRSFAPRVSISMPVKFNAFVKVE